MRDKLHLQEGEPLSVRQKVEKSFAGIDHKKVEM